MSITLEQLWNEAHFVPNKQQEDAIQHINGALYLTAGPGSGKTRVLLWRTLNLIVFHDIKPEEIFLATFTEKAALQLRDGLRALLGMVTNHTGKSYDLGRMYIGTVHSLCQRMLTDRKFVADRNRQNTVRLLDELSQYFYLSNGKNWDYLIESILAPSPISYINGLFGSNSESKYVAVSNCISLFNRMAEENLDPEHALVLWDKRGKRDSNYKLMRDMIGLYAKYREMLATGSKVELTDFSLLQSRAYQLLNENPKSSSLFKHIIIDEYQDTNAIQELIYFKLAKGHGNLCVVGDDDQAMYRFRGATVENFVQFPQRCQTHLGKQPRTIPLITNYRSRQGIVSFYNDFMKTCSWTDGNASYRVDKTITAHRQDEQASVVSTVPSAPDAAFKEIAKLVRELITKGKVQDPNQIAFLFPSLKSNAVQLAMNALEGVGLKVYAPRAGTFLEVPEAVDIFGLLVQVLGKPEKGTFGGRDYDGFFAWVSSIDSCGKQLLKDDSQMKEFVEARIKDIERASTDYNALMDVANRNRWTLDMPYNINTMKNLLHSARGLSERAKRTLTHKGFEYSVRNREQRGDNPITLDYVIKRATSVDWNLLDLFYRFSGFEHFRKMYDLAESGEDEGPICNLSLITQYLGRFMDEYLPVLRADMLADGRFIRLFFMSYLYTLYRRGESEYENAEDPFPKGRIPFLTIHQSKGLEFPVVVLGNARKDDKGLQVVEKLVRPLLDRDHEPEGRSAEFDIMRMFYVSLSRAKNLLIVANFKGSGQRINKPFQTLLPNAKQVSNFDITTVPVADESNETLPHSYSYTSDYLQYLNCPRQYMVFRKYGFVASRSQTMLFGSLVHQTLEDLHNMLISQRENAQ